MDKIRLKGRVWQVIEDICIYGASLISLLVFIAQICNWMMTV